MSITKRMKRGKLICLIGIDGTGKTTVAKRIAKYNTRLKYVHALYLTRILWPVLWLGRAFFLKKKNKFQEPEEYSKSKQKVVSSISFMVWVYIAIALLDYFPQVLRKVYIPLRFGQNLVCDRYLYDTIINISMNTSFNAEKVGRLLNMCFHFFPKPNIVILLDVNEEIAWSRKSDIPSEYYLKERRELYLSLSKHQKMFIFDASQTPETVYQNIKRIIDEYRY